LHTVVDGKMVEQKEGFKLPANGTLEMKPGGEHIMIMDNHDELAAGDKVTVQLKFKDGSTEKVVIPVREQPSGEENYGGDDSSDMSGMPNMPGMSESAQPGGQEMGGQADHSMPGHSH
ncbi:copper chaperone PCu(A)C, partial [Klebsiella pneumoniae]|uniref:copper chaperone PCu(A)C n=2 Tax=Bacteria TaxID=2 RepID=UPI0010AA1BE9